VFLMDQPGLKQKDLIDVFGTPSIVSEVMNGKRDLNKAHIERLSKRFHVSPELFFWQAAEKLTIGRERRTSGVLESA
jgi:antitoxin component HigA of HigAB toxin-antitoxin module